MGLALDFHNPEATLDSKVELVVSILEGPERCDCLMFFLNDVSVRNLRGS